VYRRSYVCKTTTGKILEVGDAVGTPVVGAAVLGAMVGEAEKEGANVSTAVGAFVNDPDFFPLLEVLGLFDAFDFLVDFDPGVLLLLFLLLFVLLLLLFFELLLFELLLFERDDGEYVPLLFVLLLLLFERYDGEYVLDPVPLEGVPIMLILEELLIIPVDDEMGDMVAAPFEGVPIMPLAGDEVILLLACLGSGALAVGDSVKLSCNSLLDLTALPSL